MIVCTEKVKVGEKMRFDELLLGDVFYTADADFFNMKIAPEVHMLYCATNWEVVGKRLTGDRPVWRLESILTVKV